MNERYNRPVKILQEVSQFGVSSFPVPWLLGNIPKEYEDLYVTTSKALPMASEALHLPLRPSQLPLGPPLGPSLLGNGHRHVYIFKAGTLLGYYYYY